MWKLYRLIGTVSEIDWEDSMVANAERIMTKIDDKTFLKSLEIMYEDILDTSPIHLATLFVWGLQKVEFFSFIKFIKDFING